MIGRSWRAEWPMEFQVRFQNLHFIDACMPCLDETIAVKFLVFIVIESMPLVHRGLRFITGPHAILGSVEAQSSFTSCRSVAATVSDFRTNKSAESPLFESITKCAENLVPDITAAMSSCTLQALLTGCSDPHLIHAGLTPGTGLVFLATIWPLRSPFGHDQPYSSWIRLAFRVLFVLNTTGL